LLTSQLIHFGLFRGFGLLGLRKNESSGGALTMSSGRMSWGSGLGSGGKSCRLSGEESIMAGLAGAVLGSCADAGVVNKNITITTFEN
jgi:hypothetical protein